MDHFLLEIDRFQADRPRAMRQAFQRLVPAQIALLVAVVAFAWDGRAALTLALDLVPLGLIYSASKRALKDKVSGERFLLAATQAVLSAAAFHVAGAGFGVAFAAFSYLALSAYNDWRVIGVGAAVSMLGLLLTSAVGALTGVAFSASALTYDMFTTLLFAGPLGLLAFIAQRNQEQMSKKARWLEEQFEVLAEAELLEESNKAKSEFLANMSHEIRTPLTAIQGFADLLDDPGTSESERAEYIGTIRRNTGHLLQIINDILDLSKIEAGKMSVEAIPTEPAGLMRDVHSLLRMSAEQKGVHFEVVYETPIPEVITSDPTRVRQILLNLTSNAIKFTDEGSVTIAARFEDGKNPRLRFDVRDTGIGLTDEQRNSLFQAFRQADTSTTRKFGGTGLGLVISQQMAEMLGGGIEVTSTYGVGSTFSVIIGTGDVDRVPMLDAPDETHQRVTALVAATHLEDTPGARVLLAEDGLDNQRLISHVLRKAGAEVTIVDNGAAAVEAALGAMGAEPFHVVFMDMQMPVMDGYTATQTLRDAGYVRPIIALTAHAMADDRHKCLEAGCDDYLTKPIDRRAMIERVQDALLDEEFLIVRAAANVNEDECAPAGEPPLEAAPKSEASEGNKSQSGVMNCAPTEPLRSTFADDPDMAPLVDLFIEELPGYLATLEESHASGDGDTFKRAAHQLKGAGGGYGFGAITEAARVLEEQEGDRDNALQDLRHLVSRIEAGRTPLAA